MYKIVCIFGKGREKAFQQVKDSTGSRTTFYGLYDFIDKKYQPFECFLPKYKTRSLLSLLKELRGNHALVTTILFFSLPFVKLLHPRKKLVFIAIDVFANIVRKKSFLKRLWFKLQLISLDKIICFSTFQKNKLVEFGVREDKISVFHFGVDVEFIQKQKDIFQYQKPFFLAVGRDVGRDISTLLNAVEELPQYNFVIVSDGKIPITKKSKNIEHLQSLGFVELISLYKAAQGVIVSTFNEEKGLGSDCSGQTVVLDGLATGTPVLVSKRSWFFDYPEITKSELFVSYQSENKDSLKEAIRKTPKRGSSLNFYSSNTLSEEWFEFFKQLFS